MGDAEIAAIRAVRPAAVPAADGLVPGQRENLEMAARSGVAACIFRCRPRGITRPWGEPGVEVEQMAA